MVIQVYEINGFYMAIQDFNELNNHRSGSPEAPCPSSRFSLKQTLVDRRGIEFLGDAYPILSHALRLESLEIRVQG